jgi:hypothetical protein
MSDLRGLSTPPAMETSSNAAKFVGAFVVAAMAAGAVGYVYTTSHANPAARQTVAANDVHTAALSSAARTMPSAAAPVAPEAVAPAPAATRTPVPAPAASRHKDAAPAKAPRVVKMVHADSFGNAPASDAPQAPDTAQPAAALNPAPQQAAPQDSQIPPPAQQVTPPQNESPQPPASQTTPDPNTQQNIDQQNQAPQQTQPSPQ